MCDAEIKVKSDGPTRIEVRKPPQVSFHPFKVASGADPTVLEKAISKWKVIIALQVFIDIFKELHFELLLTQL